MNIRTYALILGGLLSIQTVVPSSVPMQPLTLARPGASCIEIEQSIASLEQNIEIARRLGNEERVQELLIFLSYYRNQLLIAQGKSAEQLEREAQLIRISARNSSREWKNFWENTAAAGVVVACAIITLPVLVISIKMTVDLIKGI